MQKQRMIMAIRKAIANILRLLRRLSANFSPGVLPGIPAPATEENGQMRTGTYDRICGAEIGAGRQEYDDSARQAVASRHDRPRKTDKPNTPINRAQSKPLSTRDKGFQEAGEGIRTLDVQLGKLAFYH